MPLRSLAARATRRRAALAVLVAVLADAAWTLVGLPASVRGRERSVAELPAAGPPALVLGGDLDRRGEPSPVLEARLRAALEVYQAGKAPWLLVSGFDEEPRAMRRWLLRQGVPPAAIVADYSAVRTHQSLQRAAALFGLTRVVVVTSDFHLPRALWLAGHLGLDAEGVAAPSARSGRPFRWGYRVREYLARNRALLDVWFPPAPGTGPHDPPP